MKLNRRARVAVLATLALAATALLVTAVASARPTHAAAAQKRTRITMMIGGMNKIIYSAATLAKTLGYYEKAGIDVYPIDSPAGIEEADALVAGQIDAAMGFYNHTIDLAGKGKATECVVQIGLTPGHAIVVPPGSSIKSVSDFKGKVLGITGTGSSTDFELQFLGLKNGIQPSQFTRLPVGAGSTFIASLTHGQIDGGITSQPTIGLLLKTGQAKVILDLQTASSSSKAFGGTFPSTCVYMRSDYVKKHPDAVQKFVNAFVWTLEWVHTHSAAQIAAKLPDSYKGTDLDLYTADMRQSLGFFSPTGLMPKDGPVTMFKLLSTFEPDLKNAHVDLSKTYTNQFVLAAQKTKAPPAR